MVRALGWLLIVSCCWLRPLSAEAAFTSLYAFGDGVCTTTNGPGGALFYEKRFTNGRVWLEVLAQRQGLVYDANKNWSYFGHYSGVLLTNLTRFAAPADASTALFVVWVNDADFVWNVEHYGTDLGAWTAAMNRSLTNHYKAITNLYYGKGARTLVLPNAVDIAKTPYYSGVPAAEKSFIRQRILEYDANFAALLNQVRAECANLTICAPDFFGLVDDFLAHPGDYGLIKPATDALEDPALVNKALNGPGTNYVFWDYLDPSAKTHMILADHVQELIAPVRIEGLRLLGASNELAVANVPVGKAGVVNGSSDLANWTALLNFSSTNVTQSIVVPASGWGQFYRLSFPFVWTWP